MFGWRLQLEQHDDLWTKRRLGDAPLRCSVLSRHIDVDKSDRWLAFSVHRSLATSGHAGAVQLPSISWYAIVDVSSGELVATGPRSLDPRRRVMDRVIGWSPSHLVVKRSRLIHAGEAPTSNAGHPTESAEDEVSIVLVSPHGEERVLSSFVCRSDHGLSVPPPCSDYVLGNFTLCRGGNCLVFTRLVPVFREQANPALPQRRIMALDETQSREEIFSIDLTTGKERVIGATPAGWRCEDVWYDCSSGKVQAILSSRRGGDKVLGVAAKAAKAPSTLKLLQVFEKAFWGQLSPDGATAVLVNGSGSEDTSAVQMVRIAPRPSLLRKMVVPGWRRRTTWSRDSRWCALWYNVWFHDKLGRKYQRLQKGYRIWVVDATGTNAHPVGTEWAGDMALTWSRRHTGLFVIANGTLGYLNTRTGDLCRIWEFPGDWHETQG